MRRKVWARAGGYCEERVLFGNEDWDFWLAASAGGLVAAHVAEPLYRYRRLAGSLSIKLRDNDIGSRELMYRRHRQVFDRYGAGPAFLSEGCVRTALAARARHEWRYALQMAARAYRLSPEPTKALRTLVKGATPHVILRGLSFGRRLVQPLARATLGLVAGLGYRFRGGRKAYWEHRARDLYEKWGHETTDHEVLRAILARLKPRRVLDVGCGNGRLFPLYLECGVLSVLGQDVSEVALGLARSAHPDPRVELVAKPLLAMDLPAGSCDLSVSNRVLQHIPESEIDATVAKLCSWSQWVYICELASDEPNGQPRAFYMFARDYVALFRRYGFEIVDCDRSGVKPWVLFGKSEVVRRSPMGAPR